MKPPHWSLALTEAPRALIDIASLQLSKCLLRKAPRGDGHGVMVIPGFMGDDPFNRPLVKFLNSLGYRATGWQMGRNLGPRSFSADDLRLKLENLARAGDGTVSLIGHSLGGIYAREMARMAPYARLSHLAHPSARVTIVAHMPAACIKDSTRITKSTRKCSRAGNS